MPRSTWPLALAAALLFSTNPAWAQGAAPSATAAQPALTLEQALSRAQAGSPLLAAARLELAASDGTVIQAGTRPNPELDAQLEDFRQATRTTTATLSIPLELGRKREARVAAAEEIDFAGSGDARRQGTLGAWRPR